MIFRWAVVIIPMIIGLVWQRGALLHRASKKPPAESAQHLAVDDIVQHKRSAIIKSAGCQYLPLDLVLLNLIADIYICV